MSNEDKPENTPKIIYDLDFKELQSILEGWGEPAFRSKQIWSAIYQQLVHSPEEISTLPVQLRNRLSDEFNFSPLTPVDRLASSDRQTVKTLFRLADQFAIEAVLMGYSDRQTLCISSQAGCLMNCSFCATGQMGFQRHLTSGEIIAQVIYYAQQLKTEGKQVTNIVLMGMGEPFHNYDAVLAAMDRLNDSQGYNFGARRFTISTVGIIPGIRRFTEEDRQYNLAISLHAATDELRSSMLPINKKYPIAELMSACRDYVDKTHRRVTFEWALIQDINDTPAHATELANLVKGMLCHVNVIPLNPTHRFSGKATTRERAEAFRAQLEFHGIPCTVRMRRGIDIQAGCGQLATASKKPINPS
jgi:23S rRNA (adenine2503-C2)-methyltransferase